MSHKELVSKEHEKFAESYSSAESNYGPRNAVLLEPHKILIKPSSQENYECEIDETYSVSCKLLIQNCQLLWSIYREQIRSLR